MRILTAAVAALMGSTLGGAEAVPASVRGEAPLVFEANWGQLDPEVAYASRADGYEVLLDSAGARLVLTPEAGRAGAFLKFSFRDASPFATPIGIEELRGRVSYLAGADAASWTSGIPTFAAVTRTEIYPFVDLTYRGEGRGLRIELVLLPGADEESIRLTVEGTDSLGIDASTEDLVASVAGAEIRFLRPEASQTLPGGRSRDAGSWVITGPQEVGVVSPRHDPASPLVLSVPVAVPREIRQPTFADPVRIATDAAGNAYVTGRVATLPGEKAGAYVTKIAPDGKTRLFTTYFGGEGTDVPLGIAVDAGGEAVITGRTSSAAFPLVHPLASSLLGATDAFVARLAPDGGSFVYSTYLGGEGDDEGTAIDLDAEGTAWVTGRTSGEGLSVGIDAAQSVAAGGWDAFVAGLSPNGSRLTAATLAGGSGDDEGSAIRVGRDGTVYVAGSTDSADFPVIAALQSTLADGRGSGAGDAFVTAMDPVTGRFLFATYLGGAGEDTATGLGLDGEGNLHVAGRTTSPDLPPGGTPGAPGRYVATLSPGGTELRQVTRLAATPEDAGDGFAIDDSGDFWIAGGGALASKRSPDGRVLDRIGGPMPGGTRVTGVALAPGGGAFVAGLTTGRALPGAMTLESSLFGEQAFAATGAASRESIAAAGCPGTIVFYDGGGTGAWEDPNNWTLGRLPNSADDVCIPAIYAVTLSSGTQSIHSLYVANGSSLTVSGANFSITTASQIDGTFTLHSGIVSGSGDITTEHIFTWDGGSLIGAANFFANAGMSLAGSASRILSSSRVLTVTGTTTWTGPGSIQVGSGAGIVNNGTWDCQSDASVTGGGSSVGFTNTSGAIFKKTGDAGTTSVSIPFNNDGTVTVQTGTLSLSGGGTSSGAFQASPGTTLQFSGGVHSLTSTSSIAADSVVFSAGTSTVDGDYAATSGTTVSGATATFDPAATVASIGSALLVSAGTASFSSGETLTPTTLTVSGGTLRGTDTITVSGLTTWTSGTMRDAGTTNANGGVSITGGSTKSLTSSRVLTTSGTTTWTGTGSIQVGSGAGIVSNGTWDCQSDASLTGLSSPGPFTNSSMAVFEKSAGAGTTTVGIAFDNDGTVTVQTGTLSLSGGGTSSGAFQAAPGTTLQFSGGIHSLTSTSGIAADSVVFSAGTSTVDGAYAATSGTTVSGATATFDPAATVTSIGSALLVSAGTASFSSGETLTPTTLTLSGGTLRGTDTITVSGLTTWSFGTMRDAGTTNANGGVSIAGGSTKSLTSSRILTTSGTTTWTGTGSIQVSSGSTITNNGTWDCQSDASMTISSSPGPFTNGSTATFRKSAGAGASGIAISFQNAGSVQALAGLLQFTGGYVQTAGSTTLDGGSISSSTTMDIQGGELTGAGTITANVTSAGHAAPGLPLGQLTISGNYTQSMAGSLDVSLGGTNGGTDYDQLLLTGTGVASLGGTLNVDLVNGFTSTGGDSFTLMTFTSATGAFQSTSLPPGCWQLLYNPTSVVLEYPGAPEVLDMAFAADAETLSWTPLAGPVVYDVMRGSLSMLPVGDEPDETCLASQTSATSTSDATLPAPGAGFYYLARATDSCGVGSYGTTSGGSGRTSTVCP